MRPPFLVSGTPFGVPGGALEAPKSPKTAYLALITTNSPKKLNKAQSCLNIIEHIQGDMLKPFRPLERATGGCQKHPKMAIFEPKIAVLGHF